VPQPFIHAITPGQKAGLTFTELPGRIFEAKVTRTAGALDPASRTLQVEMQVPNPRGEILAGSYAQVRFNEAAVTNVLTLSDNALVFRAQGMQAALVGSDNKVKLQSVTLGRDFGNTVEVLAGLSATDRVINNPPDSIADGMTVQVVQTAETNSAAK
jgi:multidrug efflux pump subunit AcrA (membrane-fusion protein)